jgi:hypothetical protein
MATVTLYHGTDIESALDILNHGLDEEKLRSRQTGTLQSGPGWYTAIEPNVAWFFATLAADALEVCTVIEMQLPAELLADLIQNDLARREVIVNVPFQGEQVWFALDTFAVLNCEARFGPYREEPT